MTQTHRPLVRAAQGSVLAPALLLLLAAGCAESRTAGSGADRDGGPARCGAGETHLVPGCGEPALPEAGCYRTCTSAADCRDAEACETRVVDPCVCDPGEDCCAACGAEVGVCLPDDTTCPWGETYHEPGCGEPALPAAGCYAPCAPDDPASAASCPGGGACERVWVNPCVCDGPGPCCDACGAEAWLCLGE